jgi:hypothetical protein
MDSLDCIVTKRDGRYDVSVVYQNFQPGLELKRVKS